MNIRTLILIAGLLGAPLLNRAQDCPPVAKLKQLYDEDREFRKTWQATFDNLQDMPDGAQNPWRGKDMEDVYAFLNEWFFFLPDTHNGLDLIIEFSMLYYHNPVGLKLVLEEPGLSWTNYFVAERGKFMDSPASTEAIATWMADPTLANEEFVTPPEGFNSFNEFFTRDVKPGARPVSDVTDNSILVSPADGVINMINNDLQLDTELPTKAGMTLSLNSLLDNSKYAEHFVGGTAMAVFLMPNNYHHYHAPISGLVVESKELVGDRLFGMSDIPDMVNNGNPGYNKDYSVLQDFKHGYFVIKTEEYGYVGMVAIGLQTVGSVVFEDPFKMVTDNDPQQVFKGDKLGHFAYGGSTVLLMFEPGRLNAVTIEQGQRIGQLNR